MDGRLRAADTFPERDFPLWITQYRAHRNTGPSLHSHEFHELVVIVGGSGRHLTNSESYPIDAGDVFLIRGKMVHGYANTRRLTLANILFDPVGLRLQLAELKHLPGYHVLFHIEPKLRRDCEFHGRLKLTTDQLAEATQLIARTEGELSAKESGYRFMARTHLMHLIGYLSRCYSNKGQSKRQPLLIMGEVLSYIEKHYDEFISVDRLVDMASMSESSLMRTFRKVTGKSPIDYVINVRIAKAAELLQQGDLRITEVAFECGFSDSNYFSRQFRRVMGCSPREYRRRL